MLTVNRFNVMERKKFKLTFTDDQIFAALDLNNEKKIGLILHEFKEAVRGLTFLSKLEGTRFESFIKDIIQDAVEGFLISMQLEKKYLHFQFNGKNTSFLLFFIRLVSNKKNDRLKKELGGIPNLDVSKEFRRLLLELDYEEYYNEHLKVLFHEKKNKNKFIQTEEDFFKKYEDQYLKEKIKSIFRLISKDCFFIFFHKYELGWSWDSIMSDLNFINKENSSNPLIKKSKTLQMKWLRCKNKFKELY